MGCKIGFRAFKEKLMAEGHSEKYAGGTAYKQGVKKYGKEEMAEKARIGRAKARAARKKKKKTSSEHPMVNAMNKYFGNKK